MAKWGEVTRITEVSRLDPKRGIIKIYRHIIMTKGGSSLTVDIDQEDFTAEKAEPILRAKAEEADRILRL